MRTVAHVLAHAAALFPDRPFMTVTEPSGQRSAVSYQRTCQRVGALAAALAAREVGSGTKVLAALPNQFELVYLWFAVTALDATLVPLDPRLTDWELSALIAHADPALLVLPEDRREPAGGRPILRAGSELDAALSSRGQPMPAPADPGNPAVVLYTSGSTGRPKGCVLPHDSFVVPAGHMASRLRLTSRDVALLVLPLHHMAGLSFLTTALTAGASVELAPRFSGTRFWDQARASGATVFRHLGEMLAMLCAQPPVEAEQGHRLRLAYGAGATPAIAAQFTARFGVPTLEGYGTSETNTVLCGDLDDPQPGALGQPLPHVQVRLMGPAGEVAGTGVGELQIRPALMRGYLGSPTLTAAAFDGEWYRTGDLVTRDAHGRLRFVRRINDVIRRRGENIDPAEIEEAAENFDGVRRAAAIAVAGQPVGTDIKLYLEPAPGRSVSAEDVLAHCAGQLASFKLPRYVEIVDRLPLTATQKVDKIALRQLAMLSSGQE